LQELWDGFAFFPLPNGGVEQAEGVAFGVAELAKDF